MSAAAEPGTRRLAPVLCSESSAERGEPLGATASRADHWILLEYRRLWSRDVLAGSGLTEEVKAHLRRQLDALPRSRLLFVKRPDRRDAEGIALFFGATGEHGGRLFGLELEAYDDVRRVDMAAALTGGAPAGEPVERLLVVCTHGKRDRCCALHGRPLYDALRRSEHGEAVWQSTHVGGDRFAGNLVALPDGLYFGRVGPRDAAALVDELDGRADPARALPRPVGVRLPGAGGRAPRARGDRPARVRRSPPRRRRADRPGRLARRVPHRAGRARARDRGAGGAERGARLAHVRVGPPAAGDGATSRPRTPRA